MNPLILSLICLVSVGVSANLIKLIRINFIKFADTPTETKQISDNIKGFITKLLS